MTGHASDARPSVAIVGCGAWGKTLLRTFAARGALRAVGAVVSPGADGP